MQITMIDRIDAMISYARDISDDDFLHHNMLIIKQALTNQEQILQCYAKQINDAGLNIKKLQKELNFLYEKERLKAKGCDDCFHQNYNDTTVICSHCQRGCVDQYKAKAKDA